MNPLKWLFDRSSCSADRETFWGVVSERPLIVYVQGSVKHVVFLHRALAGQRACILRGGIGCEEAPKYAQRWSRYYRRARCYYPEHTVHFLANTPTFTEAFARRELPVLFCSQNGLLDERMFDLHLDVPKEFDAVLNSQMEAVKRHHLASGVERLALITYRLHSEPEYCRQTRELLRDAAWLNFESGEYRTIAPEQMSRQLSRARVGLILSAAEGANYATVEYLLSGLPVVSTRSLGGRDVFFDDEFVAVVDDTPEAVARGVRELIERRVDPQLVRRRTLDKVRAHREVFVELLQQVCTQTGVKRDMRAEWDSYFFNKLHHWRPLAEFAGQLAPTAPR